MFRYRPSPNGQTARDYWLTSRKHSSGSTEMQVVNRTTTFAARWISTGQCRGAISGQSAKKCRQNRERTMVKNRCPRGTFVRVRVQVETMKELLPEGLHLRAGLRDCSGLSADRSQLPVLAGSVHHHYGAARGSGGYCALSLCMTRTTLSVPALMGAIMCMWRCYGQQYSCRIVC